MSPAAVLIGSLTRTASHMHEKRDQVLTQYSQPKVDRDDDDVPAAGQDGTIITGSRIPLVGLAVYEN